MKRQRDTDRTEQDTARSRYLVDRESIWRVFTGLRDQRARVTLRFEGVETEYTAGVNEVEHRRVTLDDISPPSGNALLASGRSFALTARSNGAYLYAPINKVDGAAATVQATTFVIPLPGKLLWQQRRRGPRFRLPASLRSGRARLAVTHRGHRIAGTIEDMSASGCRVNLDQQDQPFLVGEDRSDQVQIDVAGLLSIEVQIFIRHRAADPQTGLLGCGVEFTRLGAEDRRRLDQFIRTLALRDAQS